MHKGMPDSMVSEALAEELGISRKEFLLYEAITIARIYTINTELTEEDELELMQIRLGV